MLAPPTQFFAGFAGPIEPGTELTLPPQAHSNAIHLAQVGLHQMSMFTQPITDTQVAMARLHKQGHRPLGRTQSAPLPLGHPMLTGATALNIVQTHYENSEAERQAYEQQHLQHAQNLRHTVLARVAHNDSLKEDDGEVMDLTGNHRICKHIAICVGHFERNELNILSFSLLIQYKVEQTNRRQ